MLTMSISGTRHMLDFLAAVNRGKKPASACVEAIAQEPGYRLLLNRWRWWIRQMEGGDDRGLQESDLVDCLKTYAAGEAWTGHKRLGNLLTALDKARGRLDEHETVYRALQNLDAASIEKDVLEHLPPDAQIHTDIYVLAESHPAAYVFDGDIIVSFFPVTLDDGTLQTIAGPLRGVLRHELHHIGLATVSPAFESSTKLPDTPDKAAISLIAGLAAEGAATLFFTPVEDQEIEDLDWRITAADLPSHYERLGRMLSEILQGEQSPQQGVRKAFKFLSEPYQDNGLPVVYLLGADMCRTIAEVFGKQRLIDLFSSPRQILQEYNEAAETVGKPLVAPEVAAAVAKLDA